MNTINNTNLITKEFEGQEIAFRKNEATGVSEVRIDEVAKFCGWTKTANSGNEVIRWSRVNEHLKELGVTTCGHGDFIPEYVMYALIGKAKNENATKFMLWVGQVLVQLRTTGVVITENATEEAIDFEKKYGTYRIRKTFTNSSDLIADYNEFKELSKAEWKAKRLSGQDKIKLLSIIFNAIQNRLKINMTNLKGSEMLMMQELLTEIKSDTLKLSNNKNGGQKAGQTKLINQCKNYIQQQEEYINYYLPKQDEFHVINYHGFTENCIYGSTDEAGNLRFSKAYNIWRSKFPKHEIQIDETIDFNKPVHLYMYFDIMDKFDVSNMQKSFVDMLCLCYGVDDKYIQTTCMLNNYVEDYKDGKIYYCLKQGEWEQ